MNAMPTVYAQIIMTVIMNVSITKIAILLVASVVMELLAVTSMNETVVNAAARILMNMQRRLHW